MAAGIAGRPVGLTAIARAVHSRAWRLVNVDGGVDLCPADPGTEPELQLRTTLRTMTRVWMGDLAIADAQRSGALTILRARDLQRRLGSWLRLSPYAPVRDARRASNRLGRDRSDALLPERRRS